MDFLGVKKDSEQQILCLHFLPFEFIYIAVFNKNCVIEDIISLFNNFEAKLGFENFNKIFRVEGETEAEKNASELNVIEIMLKAIKYFKPDIITAHNGENFDWNFIIERCKALGTDIETLSRKYFNGEVIFKSKRESILKLGGEIEKFHQTVVPTIITTDSLHAVRRAQALDSNMKEANLKYVTIYSEMVKQNRVYVPGEFIDKTLVDTEKHFAFNNENGDWYMVDKNCGKEFVFDGNTKRKNIPVFNNVLRNLIRACFALFACISLITLCAPSSFAS